MKDFVASKMVRKNIESGSRRLSIQAQFENNFRFLDEGIPDHTAIYISVPVTSGRRLFKALQKHGLPLDGEGKLLPSKICLEEVLKPNIVEARRNIKTIPLVGYVIDPTTVFVPDATQKYYRGFWARVIAKKVARLVAILDWPFSFGCLYEIKIALRMGLPIYNDKEELLAKETIEREINLADREVEEYGFRGSPLFRFWDAC